MKVVIPVAGMGKRLQPHTFSTPKCLMHVAGKPILGHILDFINEIDVEEVIFVTGPMGSKIKEFVQTNYRFPTRFVDQKEALGLGHAIRCASPYFGNSPVLIVLGDTILDFDIKKFINSKSSVLGVKRIEVNARQFGIAFTGTNNKVKKLIEKPDVDAGLAIVGIYYIQSGKVLADTLDKMILAGKKKANEYQLTDALQAMIDKGHTFSTFQIDSWFDCGGANALLATNRYLLPRNVKIPKEVYRNNIIIEPVNIHPTCEVFHSIIGPYVTLAEGSKANKCQIMDSIIESYASVGECVLANSIIGANAVLKGKKISLNLGDSSIVEFG